MIQATRISMPYIEQGWITKNKYMLSYEENYLLGYMEGCRIGAINVSREILIRSLYIKGKEQGIVPVKNLVQKINRETDTQFLLELILNVGNGKLPVRELEIYYDRYFLIPDEENNVKSLWRNPSKTGDNFI